MDEIVPYGTTWISELKDGTVRNFVLSPEQAGVARSKPEELKGADAAHNAEALRNVLDAKPSAFSDAAQLTAGAALMVAGQARDIKQGVAHARDAIKSGAARAVLEKLVKVSNN
jgi:anthranilate phosphoribosyltransferase